jgi:hypothetical protein
MARCGDIVRQNRLCSVLLVALVALFSGRAASADVVIAGGTSAGAPGATVSFAVRLQTGGLEVGSTQNDLTFDPLHTPIRALPSGDPDCTVNPAIGAPISDFSFEPSGCSGAACTAVGAIVFSLLTPIPDGVLYTCTVDIATDAPRGSYPMLIGAATAASPIGDALPTSGSDGAVIVIVPAAVPVIASPASPAGLAMIGVLGIAAAGLVVRKSRRRPA